MKDNPIKDRGPNPLAANTPKKTTKGKKKTAEGPLPRRPLQSRILTILAVFGFGALIFIGIIAGFRFFVEEPPSFRDTYGVYDFEYRDGNWRFDWQQGDVVYNVPLRFNPHDVENVTVQGRLNDSFNRPIVYIAFDPEKGNFSTQALATGELSLNMVRALKVQPVAACTKNETDACSDRPILTCGTYPNTSVILIQDEGDAKIWLKEDCIVLFGHEFELLRSVDRLLYQWYGVMN